MKRKEPTLPRQLFTTKIKVNRNEIHPFTQQPSANQFPTGQPADNVESPSELFSRFTADIIKKQALFTR